MTAKEYLEWGELELLFRLDENERRRKREVTFTEVQQARVARRKQINADPGQARDLLNGPATLAEQRLKAIETAHKLARRDTLNAVYAGEDA